MSTTYSGVTVTLRKAGVDINISSFGHIGRFNAGDQIEMVLKLNKIPDVTSMLFTSNALREDLTRLHERQLNPQERGFVHMVPVIMLEGKSQPTVDLQRNCVHLVEMGHDGTVTITNLVIVMQNGEFHFVPHTTRRNVQVYRGSVTLAVPALMTRGGFPELIGEIVKYYGSKTGITFPPDTDYVEPVIDVSGLTNDRQMVVKFWSVRRGTGVGVRKDGELVKLYWGNIKKPAKIPASLEIGEIVQAQGFCKPRGKSDLTIEALGIDRIEFNAATAA